MAKISQDVQFKLQTVKIQKFDTVLQKPFSQTILEWRGRVILLKKASVIREHHIHIQEVYMVCTGQSNK